MFACNRLLKGILLFITTSPVLAAQPLTLYLQDGAEPGIPGILAGAPGTMPTTDTIPSAGGEKHETVPVNPLVWSADGITADLIPGEPTRFALFLNSLEHTGNAVQVRISYDFDGDGNRDRTESYKYFATNDVDNFERHSETERDGHHYLDGGFADFTGGSIEIAVWSALGGEPTFLRTGHGGAPPFEHSRIELPFLGDGPEEPGEPPADDDPAENPPGDPGDDAPDYPIPDGLGYPQLTSAELGQGLGSSSHPGTLILPASAYCDGDLACGEAFVPGNTMSPAALESALSAGLAAWRFPGTHGACAGCHTPDAFDLAVIGYHDDHILRRAREHVSEEDAQAIVGLVHAVRQQYGLTDLLHPERFRPYQPGGELLPGDTDDDRDQAFLDYIRDDLELMIVREHIDSLEEAIQAADELRVLDLRDMKTGIPFDRWSEDGFHGGDHLSGAEWLPMLAMQANPDTAAQWYALQDQYLEEPTDANLWAYYDRITEFTGNADAQAFDLAYRWSLLKYQSVQIAQHMLRHHSREYPDVLVDRDGDIVANRDIAIARFPFFVTGDQVRRHPLNCDEADACTAFPPFADATLPAGDAARRAQTAQFQRAWFWLGWQFDHAFVHADDLFQTVEGDYILASVIERFKIHHALLMAKLSVAKAAAWKWFSYPADGLPGHGKWASFSPFMVLHHSERSRNEPPLNDPRRTDHDRIFANMARMWIYLVHEDLAATGAVFDKALVGGAIHFVRNWLDDTEPQEDHAVIDQMIQEIDVMLADAVEMRTDFTGDDLSKGLPFVD